MFKVGKTYRHIKRQNGQRYTCLFAGVSLSVFNDKDGIERTIISADWHQYKEITVMVRYFNIYSDMVENAAYSSRDAADRGRIFNKNRTGCAKVRFEEGQFDA